MANADLNVMIYDQGTGYKHWALLIDGPSDDQKTVFNIMGSSGRYWYEERKPDERETAPGVDLIRMCRIPTSKMAIVRDAAESMVVHNEAPGYNCQDYVLELLDELEERGVIDREDAGYVTTKRLVRSRVEGLF